MPRKKEEVTPEQEKQFVKDSILYFYESKVNFDAHKNNFETIKDDFESDMDLLYDKFADDEGRMRIRTNDRYVGITGLQVLKVQPTNVEVNYQKFRNACKDKAIRKKVLKTSYSVIDMPGLLNFLKENGITYKDVKSFIHRDLKVDIDAMENLVEIGELDEEVVRQSTLVRMKKPYFRITPIKNKKTRATEC